MEGDFDAAGYLKAAGMSLVGPGERDGVLKVRNADGVEGTLDMNALLKSEGIQKANIIVNAPETALNVSPVDLIDRAALSFGNAQGQLSYLKKNYQDAKVVDGSIMVKNKGVWQRMDADGLGDGSGWDMAKEFAKDLLDWTGEAPVIAGQLAGAAAAGGMTAGAAAVAGAGAGAGVGRAGSIVMGRLLGTYEGDASEITRDIVLDTVLSAAGETVALGAKQAVIPKMKAGFEKIKNFADPKVKDVTVAMLKAGGNHSELGARTILEAPTETFGLIEKYQKMHGVKATADVLERDLKEEAIRLTGVFQENAQKDLSREFVSGWRKAIAATDDSVAMNPAKTLSEGMNEIAGLGILDAKQLDNYAPGTLRFKAVAKEAIAESFGVDGVTGMKIGKAFEKFATTSQALINRASTGKGLTGKQGAQEILTTITQLRDAFEMAAGSSESAQQNLKPIVMKMIDGLRTQLPEKAQAFARSADSGYAKNIEYVTYLKRIGKGQQGVETIMNQIRNGDTNFVMKALDSVSSRRPGGAELRKALNQRIAAMEVVTTGTPTGVIGAARTMAVKGSAKAFFSTAKGAAMGGQMLKGLSEKARLELLANPQAWEAVAGEVMRGLGK